MPFAVLSTQAVQAKALSFDFFKPSPEDASRQLLTNVKNVEIIVEFLSGAIQGFKALKGDISEVTIKFLTWVFSFLTKMVLHTPAFLFDSEWLKTNTLTFTGLSVIMSVVIVVYEGFQRMLGKRTARITDLSQVIKRVPIVTAISAVSPFLFYQFFKGVNWLTNLIIDMTKTQMREGIGEFEFKTASALEFTMLVAFDLALIGVLIPVFIQNFRRWFELLFLAVISPIAMSCWIFKKHEHYFHLWLNSIKTKSFTQLVYAVYLLIIGSIMFGTKTPDSQLDILIKLGIMIGGLYSMVNLPSMARRYTDNSRLIEVFAGASKATTMDVKGGFSRIADRIFNSDDDDKNNKPPNGKNNNSKNSRNPNTRNGNNKPNDKPNSKRAKETDQNSKPNEKEQKKRRPVGEERKKDSKTGKKRNSTFWTRLFMGDR